MKLALFVILFYVLAHIVVGFCPVNQIEKRVYDYEISKSQIASISK